MFIRSQFLLSSFNSFVMPYFRLDVSSVYRHNYTLMEHDRFCEFSICRYYFIQKTTFHHLSSQNFQGRGRYALFSWVFCIAVLCQLFTDDQKEHAYHFAFTKADSDLSVKLISRTALVTALPIPLVFKLRELP